MRDVLDFLNIFNIIFILHELLVFLVIIYFLSLLLLSPSIQLSLRKLCTFLQIYISTNKFNLKIYLFSKNNFKLHPTRQ